MVIRGNDHVAVMILKWQRRNNSATGFMKGESEVPRDLDRMAENVIGSGQLTYFV